jgi:triosephosphate isomerase
MNPLIAGNWQMHRRSSWKIARAARVAASRIAIGGENYQAEISGAYTGDVSADTLKDAGACAVIVGHSERRQQHGETDAMVAAKTKAAWRTGLLTITCIGETSLQRQHGKALSVCGDEIAGSFTEALTRHQTKLFSTFQDRYSQH